MNYQTEDDNKAILKIRELLKQLPPMCREVFLSMANTTTPKTRLGYAYDLKLFFNYLVTENPKFEGRDVASLNISDLENIKVLDINEYLDYLSYYIKEDKGSVTEVTNKENGKSRKLASVRKLFNYFYKQEKLSGNPAEMVDSPKLRQKDIIRLEPNEVAGLLDNIEAGAKLTKGQQRFHGKTALRDLAIVTLLLGTGIRVSELVGIDIQDIDFDKNGLLVRRKGHKEMTVYFGEEVEEALKNYLEIRKLATTLPGSENALFLSLQNKRIGVRSVENLVKKYALTVTSNTKISPHKLRSTYGTQLYNETGDIYLVADVLGHNDVNTTRKHYAQQADSNRRMAARKVTLREK
ncbi:MAG: tyrosine-type recombinase/integrase [Firmicutes bacterium]|nr:tyrosine-type recombinase/integrase [Bacillota bacterium]